MQNLHFGLPTNIHMNSCISGSQFQIPNMNLPLEAVEFTCNFKKSLKKSIWEWTYSNGLSTWNFTDIPRCRFYCPSSPEVNGTDARLVWDNSSWSPSNPTFYCPPGFSFFPFRNEVPLKEFNFF